MSQRLKSNLAGRTGSRTVRIQVQVDAEDLVYLEALVRALDRNDALSDCLRSQINDILAEETYSFAEAMLLLPSGLSTLH